MSILVPFGDGDIGRQPPFLMHADVALAGDDAPAPQSIDSPAPVPPLVPSARRKPGLVNYALAVFSLAVIVSVAVGVLLIKRGGGVEPISDSALTPASAPIDKPSPAVGATSIHPSTALILATPTTSPAPTLDPTKNELREKLLSLFCLSLTASCPPLSDPSSYQSRALSWLSSDPSVRSYPDERLLQRFALACLGFGSTGLIDEEGGGVGLGGGWMDGTVTECSWGGGFDNVGCNVAGAVTKIALTKALSGGIVPRELSLLKSLGEQSSRPRIFPRSGISVAYHLT